MVFAPRDRKQLVWPVTGIVLGALVAVNPIYAPDITLPVGIVAWCADMALVLILSAHSMGARTGSLIAGLFLAVPCFIEASDRPEGTLYPISCNDILYEGESTRTWRKQKNNS